MENSTNDSSWIHLNTLEQVGHTDLGEYFGEPYRTISIVVDSAVMLPIALGNILLILSILLFRHLHTHHYYLVLNLALSDVFVGLILLPYDIYTLVNPQSSQQKVTCLLRFALHMLSWSSAVTGLFLISAERYIAINHPFRYLNFVTPVRTLAAVVVLWVLNIIISSTPLFGANTWAPRVVCVPSNIWHLAYGCFTAFSIFPFIMVTFYMYVAVIRTSWRHMSALNKQMNILCAITKTETGELKNDDHVPNFHKTKTNALIFGIFLLCWLPFCAVLMAQRIMSGDGGLAKAKVYLLSLLKINSLLNILVYLTADVTLRNAILRLTHCKVSRISDGGG